MILYKKSKKLIYFIFQLRIKPDADSRWMVGRKYNAKIRRNNGTPEKIVSCVFIVFFIHYEYSDKV